MCFRIGNSASAECVRLCTYQHEVRNSDAHHKGPAAICISFLTTPTCRQLSWPSGTPQPVLLPLARRCWQRRAIRCIGNACIA